MSSDGSVSRDGSVSSDGSVLSDRVCGLQVSWGELLDMDLPSFRPAFLVLCRVLLNVIHECLKLRLEQRPAGEPSLLSIKQVCCKHLLAHTHNRSYTLAHTHTRSHTHSLTHTLAHTHRRSHTQALNYGYTSAHFSHLFILVCVKGRVGKLCEARYFSLFLTRFKPKYPTSSLQGHSHTTTVTSIEWRGRVSAGREVDRQVARPITSQGTP